jgi:type II secretory pathway component HofQ
VRSWKIFKASMTAVFLVLALGWFCPKNIFAQESGQTPAQPSGQQQQDQVKQSQGEKVAQPADKTDEAKKSLTGSASVMEIKRLESESPLYSIELRNVQLSDLFRVIAHDYNLNILMDQDISGTITASFTNISLEEALGAIAEMSNLLLEKKGNIVKIKPNFVTETIVLKYVEAKKLLEASSPGSAASVPATSGQPATPTSGTGIAGLFSVPGSAAPVPATSGQTTAPTSGTGIYSLLSPKGKILLGQQQNSLTVIDYPDGIKKVQDYLKVIDHKMETRVYKLKYLKADEVVGATSKTTSTTQSITPTGTQVSTTTSTTTASGTTGGTGK